MEILIPKYLSYKHEGLCRQTGIWISMYETGCLKNGAVIEDLRPMCNISKPYSEPGKQNSIVQKCSGGKIRKNNIIIWF
jgi:hypothetical protein